MLGFVSPQASLSPTPILPSKSKHLPPISLQIRPYTRNLTKTPASNPKQFRIYAEDGNGDKNGGRATDNFENGVSADEGKSKNGLPKLNMRWANLVLDPDPDNIVAVGLTGLLTWASVQVLWQLFVISAAILVAALKYSIVATLLIFILITLL